MSGRRSSLFWWPALLVAAALAGLAFVRSGPGKEGAAVAPAARARPPMATPAPASGIAGFVGVLFSRQSLDVPARMDGLLTSLEAWPGDRVAKGQVLATFDTSTVDRELEETRAAVAKAAAERDQAAVEAAEAERQWRRQEGLGGMISAAELEALRAQVALAGARLRSATADVQATGARLAFRRRQQADSTLRAPFDCAVVARLAQPGMLVRGGAPIVRVVGGDDLWVRYAVPEEQAGGVAPGARVQVQALGAPLAAVNAAISQEVDVASGMVFVEAKLEVSPQLRDRLLAGLTVRVSPAVDGRAMLVREP